MGRWQIKKMGGNIPVNVFEEFHVLSLQWL